MSNHLYALGGANRLELFSIAPQAVVYTGLDVARHSSVVPALKSLLSKNVIDRTWSLRASETVKHSPIFSGVAFLCTTIEGCSAATPLRKLLSAALVCGY